MEPAGNVKIKKLLDRIVASRKIANAYLFVGPLGTGKEKLALMFAKKLINCKSGIDSNLILIRPDREEKNGVIKKRDIKIEAIRDLQHKLSLTAMGGEYKAVIINDADRLSLAAQNALLKTLEEPNERVVLVLVSQDEKRLLPTIASRCQKIRVGLIGDDAIRENIPKKTDEPEEIIFWSAGREEIARNLVSDATEFEYMKNAKQEILDILACSDGERLKMAEKLSGDVGELTRKMNIWCIFLRQVMLGRMIIDSVSPDKALKAIEEIGAGLKSLKETNANPRLLLENLFLKL